MKRHAFNEAEVLILERRIGKRFKDLMWNRFVNTVEELGGTVQVTGGTFLTHQVNKLNEDDFNFVLEFIKN